MESKLRKAGFYIITRLSMIAIIVAVAIAAFFSSMKTSNVYFLLNDALKARLDIILLQANVDDKSNFFSYDYLQDAEYEVLRADYGIYKITNYGHKFKYSHLFVWPWQRTKTVTVREAVFSINGEIDTSQISKADAMAHDIYNVPQWKDSVYRVRLKMIDGVWVIDSVKRKGDYNYKPVPTHNLTKEEIDTLRTPSPTPSPEPTPTPQGQSEYPKSGVISTALHGEKANVREGPATAYALVGSLKSGTEITVLEESDGWYKIRTDDGLEGYVSGYFVNLK